MKGSRALLVLFLALVSGLGAMLVGAQWLTRSAGVGGEKIVIAARDIPLGTAVEPSMLQEIQWSAETRPAGAFTAPKALEGRVVKTAVARGELVLENKLAPVGTKGGLSAVIPEGKRAITVRVNEVMGVAGFALPGNYVDVMVSAQDDTRKHVSKIVLERIMVLAVAQEASRDETKPKVVNAVTLEVTPAEAEKLDLARNIGSLSLVLRNQVDQNAVTTEGMRANELLGTKADASPPPVAVPAPPKHRPVARAPSPPAPLVVVEERPKVEVIRGLQRSDTEL
jgi:pilus assembly protein CpaB